ncbi:MAG: hypothetical protein GC159_05780 [Phycisphaera sp.]|nr:hypothetical protein [Phycisphaera sp.]
MEQAIKRFFPDQKQWDYSEPRRQQAEFIQILADGPKRDTSLVIYDDGEGQHPEDFKDTFLSLLRGNKNDVHFVQGKYNMGGSGAIVFCGKKRYQLIGSKRYNNTGKFGFTLIRKHPMSDSERHALKHTWYEYLLVDGRIPAFDCKELELGLHKRSFKSGTVIKLYSYDLPTGISEIARDLNQSINEFLFEPALPVYTIESAKRYPHAQLDRHLYGLKHRLEEAGNKYIEEYFSEEASFDDIGTLKATCYVFKTRIDGKSTKETRQTISREFFKNNMSVLFSVNGQVHGDYTSEFITRSLKMNLLKNYLLIHVDCTGLVPEFRNELTMASRDRLKGGAETKRLRDELAKLLKDSKLDKINKRRKEALSLEDSQADDLVRSFAENLPLNSEMNKLLNQVFKLDKVDTKSKKKSNQKKKQRREEEEIFDPQRFPSYFNLDAKNNGDIPAISIPKGTERTIRFSTDVENMYFDRVEEPGELQVSLLDYKQNEKKGGDRTGDGNQLSHLFNVRKASPDDGAIRLHLAPTEAVEVGESVKVMASLTSPGQNLEQMFWVKVKDPERPKKKQKLKAEDQAENLGLPDYKLVAKDAEDTGWLSWDDANAMGAEFEHSTVMHPYAEGDTLKTILINMSSKVWLDYRTTLGRSPSAEQLQVAQRRYITSVYFHTLFLYMIMKTRKYQVTREHDGREPETVDVEEYLKDVFESYYADFLMHFSMAPLMGIRSMKHVLPRR